MGTVLYALQEDVLTYPAETREALGVELLSAILVNDDGASSDLLSILEPSLVLLDQTEASVLVGNNDIVQAVAVQDVAALLLEQDGQFSVLGIEVPNPSRREWIDLVANWAGEPVLVGADVGGGDVWEYTYNNGFKLYRLITTAPYTDAFYRTYSGTAVSTLVLTRGMTIN